MTDNDSTIPPNECALVSTGGMKNLELFVPDMPTDALGRTQIPRVLAFLLGCYIRFNEEPAFVAEQIAWFDAHSS